MNIKKQAKNIKLSLIFTKLAAFICTIAGNHWSFLGAFLLIIIWIMIGPFFNYSDTWQLIINTGTTIVTFLMVFLIQNTQNRDTKILNLKLDELIKSHKNANNLRLDLNKLNDDELKLLEKTYIKLCKKKKNNTSKQQ